MQLCPAVHRQRMKWKNTRAARKRRAIGRTIYMIEAKLGRRSARIAENTGRLNRARRGFSCRESRNLQRDLNLRLRRRLWNRRVRDMADLAGAVSFVVPVAVIVGDNLRAQNEDRQDERHRDEPKAKSFEHRRSYSPANHPTLMVCGQQDSIRRLCVHCDISSPIQALTPAERRLRAPPSRRAPDLRRTRAAAAKSVPQR